MLGLADLETGTAVSGARGYFLLNEGVLLNQVGSCKRVQGVDAELKVQEQGAKDDWPDLGFCFSSSV